MSEQRLLIKKKTGSKDSISILNYFIMKQRTLALKDCFQKSCIKLVSVSHSFPKKKHLLSISQSIEEEKNSFSDIPIIFDAFSGWKKSKIVSIKILIAFILLENSIHSEKDYSDLSTFLSSFYQYWFGIDNALSSLSLYLRSFFNFSTNFPDFKKGLDKLKAKESSIDENKMMLKMHSNHLLKVISLQLPISELFTQFFEIFVTHKENLKLFHPFVEFLLGQLFEILNNIYSLIKQLDDQDFLNIKRSFIEQFNVQISKASSFAEFFINEVDDLNTPSFNYLKLD